MQRAFQTIIVAGLLTVTLGAVATRAADGPYIDVAEFGPAPWMPIDSAHIQFGKTCLPAYDVARTAALSASGTAMTESSPCTQAAAESIAGPAIPNLPCAACRTAPARPLSPVGEPTATPIVLDDSEPAKSILDVMERVGPSVIQGSVFDDKGLGDADRDLIVRKIRDWSAAPHAPRVAPVMYTVPLSNVPETNFERRVATLREVSRQLELLAYELESQSMYDSADELREQADHMRQRARSEANQAVLQQYQTRPNRTMPGAEADSNDTSSVGEFRYYLTDPQRHPSPGSPPITLDRQSIEYLHELAP